MGTPDSTPAGGAGAPAWGRIGGPSGGMVGHQPSTPPMMGGPMPGGGTPPGLMPGMGQQTAMSTPGISGMESMPPGLSGSPFPQQKPLGLPPSPNSFMQGGQPMGGPSGQMIGHQPSQRPMGMGMGRQNFFNARDDFRGTRDAFNSLEGEERSAAMPGFLEDRGQFRDIRDQYRGGMMGQRPLMTGGPMGGQQPGQNPFQQSGQQPGQQAQMQNFFQMLQQMMGQRGGGSPWG